MDTIEIKVNIAAEMEARGLDPDKTLDRNLFAAEIDALMRAHMRSLGFDPLDAHEEAEFVRLLEAGQIPWPGEALVTH
jgi:hypothetical protein